MSSGQLHMHLVDVFIQCDLTAHFKVYISVFCGFFFLELKPKASWFLALVLPTELQEIQRGFFFAHMQWLLKNKLCMEN